MARFVLLALASIILACDAAIPTGLASCRKYNRSHLVLSYSSTLSTACCDQLFRYLCYPVTTNVACGEIPLNSAGVEQKRMHKIVFKN